MLTTLDDLEYHRGLESPNLGNLGVQVSADICVLLAGSQTSWQIASMSATEAVAQLCSRKMTALQYAEAVLEIAETYSCLNVFSFLDKEKVRRVCMPVLTSRHGA